MMGLQACDPLVSSSAIEVHDGEAPGSVFICSN